MEVESIRRGLEAPIRTLPPEQIQKELPAILITVAAAYCGADTDKTSSIVWTECGRLIKGGFQNIGISEILEAFRLAASGKIDVDLNTYGGQFSVKILGAVLSAYVQFRGRVAIKLENEIIAENERLRDEERAEKSKQTVEAWLVEFDEAITRKDSDDPRFKTYREIFSVWGKAIMMSREFDPKQKSASWKKALRLARFEFQMIDLSNKFASFGERTEIRAIIGEIKKDILPRQVQSRAAVIYPSVFLWDNFLRPSNSEEIPEPDFSVFEAKTEPKSEELPGEKLLTED